MTNYNQDPTTVGVLHVEVSDVQELFDIVEENVLDSLEAYDFIIGFKGRKLDSITLGELSQFLEIFPEPYQFTSAELLLMLGYVLDRIS